MTMDQTKLSSFSISGIYESNLFLISMGKPQYQLKEFSIINCDLEEYEILESFLMEHAKSLEKLVVKEVRWDPSAVLNACTRLKSFQNHAVEMGFINILPSIEDVSFEPPIQEMYKFPNVKRLNLNRTSPEINRAVTESMTKLEDLEMKFGVVNGISITNLKRLKLSSLDGPIDRGFFSVHDKIEKLFLNHVFNIDDALLESITSNLKNLKVLRILGENHLTVRAFSIIKENCKNLKTLEMTKWDQKFKREDWKCLYDIVGLKVYVEIFNLWSGWLLKVAQ